MLRIALRLRWGKWRMKLTLFIRRCLRQPGKYCSPQLSKNISTEEAGEDVEATE